LHRLQGNSPSHLVFFCLHLSQAFHTLLCLSMLEPWGESGAWSCTGECEDWLARFEFRCTGLTDFVLDAVFLLAPAVAFMVLWSSMGGVGNPLSMVNSGIWLRGKQRGRRVSGRV
jgi:hypothetical protein